MRLKNIMMAGLAAMCVATANAQEQEGSTEYVFNPHWYIQLQGGGQYTLGEIDFDKLLSPNAQIAGGYNFNKVVGLRLSVNAWQSRAGIETYTAATYDANGQLTGSECNPATYKWKWNYVQPSLDVTFNLTNLFCDYNPKRLLSFGILAGIGANIAFCNDEAEDVAKQLNARHAQTSDRTASATTSEYWYNRRLPNSGELDYLWTGTKVRFTGRLGAFLDFRLSDNWSVGLEAQANVLSDHYNSKRAGNPDWYFNALVGVKYAFGKTYKTRKVAPKKPRVERVVERVVQPLPPSPAPRVEERKPQVDKTTLRREVFFTINNAVVSDKEMKKIDEVADYMLKHMTKKVVVTGYADRGTGNNTTNDRIAAKRADVVVNALVDKGVARDRITRESKGSREQPFNANDKNRVAICIAE